MKRFTSSVLYFPYIHVNCVRAYRGGGGEGVQTNAYALRTGGREGWVKNWQIFAYVLYGWSLSEELEKLNTWFKVNKISLHVSKANLILFSGRKCINNVGISIDKVNIERVFSTKFLGIHIDEKLTWKQHISVLKGTLCECLSILYKCNKILELDSLKTLYCSIFFTLFELLLSDMGISWKNVVNGIEILQKER